MELLKIIADNRNPFLDTFFGLITMFGEETILIVIMCLLFWCVNKQMAYIMATVFFLSSLAVQGMKIIFRLDRPWVIDPNFQPVEGSVRAATGYTFPSGHTQNAAAILGSLGAQIKPYIFKIILFAVAILVAVSRVYLGVHFISDVIASLVITFGLLWLVMRFFPSESNHNTCRKRELIWPSIIAGIAIIVLIIATVSYHTELSTSVQLRDAVRSAGGAIAFAIGMYIERVYIRFSIKTKYLWLQPIKLILGLVGLVVIQEGIRLVGTTLVVDTLRYFFMVFWLIVVYPLIIKRFFMVREVA